MVDVSFSRRQQELEVRLQQRNCPQFMVLEYSQQPMQQPIDFPPGVLRAIMEEQQHQDEFRQTAGVSHTAGAPQRLYFSSALMHHILYEMPCRHAGGTDESFGSRSHDFDGGNFNLKCLR